MSSTGATRRRATAVAAAVDLLLVLGFVAVGRAEHESGPLAGILSTAWPFLVALAAGWLVARAWRAPLAPVRTGLVVWVVTVAGGVLLRLAAGDSAAPAFVVVAAATLALLLVGWRALAAAAGALRRRGR